MPNAAVKRGGGGRAPASMAKRLRQAAASASANVIGAGLHAKKRKSQQQPQQTVQEQITSESESDTSVADVADAGDDDGLETPQEARVRVAQRLISEMKAREAERLGFGGRGLGGDDSSDEGEEEEDGEDGDIADAAAAVTGAVSARLQAANLRRAGRLRASLADCLLGEGEAAASVAKNCHRLAVTCAQLGTDCLFTASKDGSLARWSLLEASSDNPGHQRHLRREAHVPGGVRPRRRKPASKSTSSSSSSSSMSTKADASSASEVLHRSHVLCMALSSDQTRLATGDADGLVLVWEARRLARLHDFRGHRGAVTALAFRRSGGGGGGGGGLHLFSGSHDKTVRHWGLGGAVDCGLGFIEALFGHSSAVLGLDSVRLERCLSCGGADRSLRLWKLAEESQLVFELPPGGGPNSCECVAMVTEQVFASGQGDGSLCLWSALKKRPTFRLPAAHGPDRWVTSLAAVKNSDLLASGSWDGFVRLWRLPTAGAAGGPASLTPLRSLPAPGFVNQLAFSPAAYEDAAVGGEGKAAKCLRLAAALGQEHRLGRWLVDKEARNVALVWRLSDDSLRSRVFGDEYGGASGAVTVDRLA